MWEYPRQAGKGKGLSSTTGFGERCVENSGQAKDAQVAFLCIPAR